MKKIAFLLLALTVFTSCDNPRSRRVKMTSSTEDKYTNPGSGIDLNNPGTGTDKTDSIIPSDATHCKFSTDGVNGFESTSTHLGAYTLCQSSTNKDVFYFQVKTPPVASTGDVKICLIPQSSSGSLSVFVGNAVCSAFVDPKSVSKITFVKNTGFSNAIINSVIFFKDTSYYYLKPVTTSNGTLVSFTRGLQTTLKAYEACLYYKDVNMSLCNDFKSVGQYVIKNF